MIDAVYCAVGSFVGVIIAQVVIAQCDRVVAARKVRRSLSPPSGLPVIAQSIPMPQAVTPRADVGAGVVVGALDDAADLGRLDWVFRPGDA